MKQFILTALVILTIASVQAQNQNEVPNTQNYEECTIVPVQYRVLAAGRVAAIEAFRIDFMAYMGCNPEGNDCTYEIVSMPSPIEVEAGVWNFAGTVVWCSSESVGTLP